MGTPKLEEETHVACVFAYMLTVFALNHEPDPRNPGSAHVMRRSSVHHSVLIPAQHKSFYFIHWYTVVVQSVSSLDFSLSDNKREYFMSPPYTTVGHHQGHQVTTKVIRALPRSLGHHQCHQVTTKVIRSPPRSSGHYKVIRSAPRSSGNWKYNSECIDMALN